ncbi:hypothetical protein [Citrifermentans bremense]|uniref:hypothetical protein n=1 Tax=Citrifermentans bremense TaxID=60035 RepID=UPI00047C3AC4|nr:hypothetical protein [Citrifermentans bremense]
MADVSITSDLQTLVERLSAQKAATPHDHSEYAALKACYVAASDLLEQSQDKSIDDGDSAYLDFSAGMKDVMAIIDEAEKDIAKVSKVVKAVAKVVEAAGKLIGKLC